jgi:translation initiation factor IF-1
MGTNAPVKVTARVMEELPALLFKLELENRQTLLATGAGAAERNWVRLVENDRVEVELSPTDPTRGRIVKKLNSF